jgi:hypothetical protein
LRQIPTARLKFVEENVDKRNYRVSFYRIRERLGFTPLWTIEEGISQVFRAISQNGALDYRDARCSNVKFLSEEGRDMLKVQNGWAKDLIECSWTREEPAAMHSRVADDSVLAARASAAEAAAGD